ncbi:hypothetical protein T492DRAFT_884666, partial [Pavlovales sp. CCMP2436]
MLCCPSCMHFWSVASDRAFTAAQSQARGARARLLAAVTVAPASEIDALLTAEAPADDTQLAASRAAMLIAPASEIDALLTAGAPAGADADTLADAPAAAIPVLPLGLNPGGRSSQPTPRTGAELAALRQQLAALNGEVEVERKARVEAEEAAARAAVEAKE